MHIETNAVKAIQREDVTKPTGITIQDVSDIEQLRMIEELQARVWGEGPRDIVPSHVLWLVGKSGGIVLGAFLDGELVGFVMGLLAQQEDGALRGARPKPELEAGAPAGRLYHASHILGVDQTVQGSGIGAALKWRQRERAIEQGLDLMTWTFDPLQSRNAYFNLHKLGATSNTYIENAYGDMDDDLNRGLPSDRLLVEWALLDSVSSAGRPLLPAVDVDRTVTVLRNDDSRPELRLDERALGSPLAVAVPREVGRLKDASPEAALEWRVALRAALTWAFDRGYRAVDFRDGAYLLAPD